MLAGLFFSVLSGMPGWGRYIPLDPSVIQGKFRKFKIVIQNFARSFMHFIVFLITSIILIFAFKILMTSTSTIFGKSSSLVESLKSLFVFFLQQNKSLCIIYAIIGMYRTISFFVFEKFEISEPTNLVIKIGIFLFSMILGWTILHRLLIFIILLLEKVIV